MAERTPATTLARSKGSRSSAALHHPERDLFDPLERREAALAAEAFAAPADGTALFGLARIHHAVVIDTAPRTPHSADDSQGMKMCSPGTTRLVPVSRTRLSVKEAECSGSARVAMDARVSPALTMYS